ncbi:MAG: response regulator transcription factor [Microscillaceae bacterium]|nr:response regulator transcription factor [Microscillaceae bacterium]
MKILIIEDEKALAESLADYLQHEGYRCEMALDYQKALEKIQLYDYEAIILDLTLPDGNGLELLRSLRQAHNPAGVLIVSARNALADKLSGLDLGADDYMTKPFHLAELNARLKSIIRRKNYESNNQIVFQEISINPATMEVSVNGNPMVLTRKEYELLLYFIHNKNRLLTKEAIAEHLWGDNMDMADSYDFIYTHIKNLRKKIVELGGQNYLKTMYGMGYKFSE